jgi:hypothetical protein
MSEAVHPVPEAVHPVYQIASLKDVNVKSLTLIGGINALAPLSPLTVLTGFPNASRLFNIMIGLSLNRKFFTGYLISPFSI